jgi:nucleoside-triphosphatase THEP1
MINIITGKIDSGKTTKMIEIYNQTKQAEGFATKKIYKNETNIGQRIVNLSTGEDKLFSLKINYISHGWVEEYRYYDYSFSSEGIQFAEGIIYNAINNKAKSIFIDEIGPLEICNEQGLFNALVDAIASSKDLFITVRDNCLEQFIKKFGVREYNIL